MKLLGYEYEYVKVGKLEVATTNLYYSKLAIGENNGNYYFDYLTACQIDELLVAEGTGFRVPTVENFAYLGTLGGRWVVAEGNEIAGCFFGKHCGEAAFDDPKDCVFFPALGYIDTDSGLLCQQGYGYYWSRTYTNSPHAYILRLYDELVYPGVPSHDIAHGLSVRCVRER
ncbi:MAG: fibrobacter succinogenes major paralogous domain-containing protein [Tannerella sp.]|jgi:uncharacterized protein (TIGR02145 family)|nr:fibrobacter succinogenes major paralogous domain-containing protein [Tannerella sp.]